MSAPLIEFRSQIALVPLDNSQEVSEIDSNGLGNEHSESASVGMQLVGNVPDSQPTHSIFAAQLFDPAVSGPYRKVNV
jgi:hypothetical protein